MSVAADRNLLFGLLALQIGMIDQSALVAAFHAWTRDKTLPIAEILIKQGAIDGDDRSLLEALVTKHMKRHGDDVEKSLAAVPVPRVAISGLVAMDDADVNATIGHLGPRSEGIAPNDPTDATASLGRTAGDSQRFRVLRPHARGGLGAVFVALDAELNREVALKQILDHHADDTTSRTRFVLEAEITGGLEHPGIVPVYGLGASGDGRPYYAMRFIRGDSLKDVIAAFHADPKTKDDPGHRSLALRMLLRRFTDVCNAIEYAHTRGVIHRDIKPANILLGKYGETLVVDWGLAKPLGRADSASPSDERTLMPSSASGTAETLPGSAMGTPSYMSPEQAAGDLQKIGPRSDVYSLGATLYCLLTGKAPFEGDLFEVLRSVQKGDYPSPRKLNTAIDPALEAVCQKAMATRPEDRYASCRALADDVERWTADEPVSAYREPFQRKARRWAKRNRTAVTAAAVALVAGLAGLAAVAAVQTRAKDALAAKNGELTLANTRVTEANANLAAANAKVEARFELAREAIRSFKTGVEQDETLKNDSLKSLRDKLLGSARQFYDKLGNLLQGQADAASKAVLAESYMELGELIDKIGQKPESLAAFNNAVAIRRELAALPGADNSDRIELAHALNEQGWEAQQLNDHAGGLAAYEEARALAEPLATGPNATLAARRALGFAHHRIGLALSATGKTLDALAAYHRARDTREALIRDPAALPDDRHQLTYSISNIGYVQEITGNTAGAMAEYRKSQDMTRALVSENSTVADYRRSLAVSHRRIGRLLQATGDTAGALFEFRKALDLAHALVAESPAVADYRRDLAVNRVKVGQLLQTTGDTAGAMVELRQALKIWEALVAESPTVADYRSELAVNRVKVGQLLQTTGDTAGAMVELRQALKIWEALVAESPTVADYRSELAVTHNWIAYLLENAGDTAGALVEYRKARDLTQALVAESPAVADFRRDLAASHNLIGRLLQAAGKAGEALGELDMSRALFEALTEASPKVADYRDRLATALNASGDALLELGRPDEARDRFAGAVALREALASAQPKSAAYQSGLANGLRRLAQAKLAAHDAANAVADARRAVGLYERLKSRDQWAWFGLACAQATLSAAGDGSRLAAAESAELADRAMENLRRAAAMGYREVATYRREPALAPLLDRADFKLLMMDLAFPADPFVKAL